MTYRVFVFGVNHIMLKKVAILIISLALTALVNAQDFYTAAELAEMGEDLSSQVGANNAAILNDIINEGGYFAAMVHREPGPGFSESHADWADLYFVTSGSATIITDGSIVNATENDPGEVRGTGIDGGSARSISAGDVVHIPAGIPHHVLVEDGNEITYFIFKAKGLLPGERRAAVTAIPGVVAEGARWQSVWADPNTADGIVGTTDGGVIFAQEQTDSVRKLINGNEYILFENTNGGGAVSMDADGRLFIAERACTEPLNAELAGCNELTRIAQLDPEYRLLANQFADGTPLGRVNDLIADGQGGAFFTSRGAWHVSAEGDISVVADENIFSNGIMLNRDGSVLYVTNNTEVLAFDVRRDGSTRNRRVFSSLDGDNGGDGMAIDNEGRLYVTGNAGIHVIAGSGDYLGLIPTPRRPITIAFSGPDKRTLFAPSMGAVGPDGKAWTTPEGIRNIAMTLYTLEMEAQGFLGRPK